MKLKTIVGILTIGAWILVFIIVLYLAIATDIQDKSFIKNYTSQCKEKYGETAYVIDIKKPIECIYFTNDGEKLVRYIIEKQNKK